MGKNRLFDLFMEDFMACVRLIDLLDLEMFRAEVRYGRGELETFGVKPRERRGSLALTRQLTPQAEYKGGIIVEKVRC